MPVRITTLSENTAGEGNFLAEWGLSILVEADSVKVLLDTGKSISTTYNADTLGIDLGKIDKIVLSHGHADHTGGLREVLRRVKKKEIEIIAHPHVWAYRYRRRPGEADRFGGMPFQRGELENLGAIFNLTTKPVKITDSIMTSGEIPMVTDFEEIDSAETRFIKEDADSQPDEILDDQAIIINTEKGLVIITGCAHRGIVNTLYHARQLTGNEMIYAVVGGSHLINTSEERLWQTIAALRELDVQRLGLCHCTDLPAASVLAQEFGESFFFNKVGSVIDFP